MGSAEIDTVGQLFLGVDRPMRRLGKQHHGRKPDSHLRWTTVCAKRIGMGLAAIENEDLG
jgi:hypothetical protein